MTALIIASVFPWLLIAVGAWLGYQFTRQNGRILLRLEAIEKRLAGHPADNRRKPAGLPIGSPAPDFELPDLAGGRRKLSEFRGKDVLLLFFSPKCGFCTKMAADLAALPTNGDGQPIPIVVTNGDADENRKLVEQSGVRCVVLRQKKMEVAAQYRAHGTPTGYRIDAEGRIASELAVGAEPLLMLADVKSSPRPATSKSGIGPVHRGKQPHPSLARSRLNRSGLKAGAVAPDFRLAIVTGGELALSDLRGRRVLLVFSDPKCGPCDELAPRLQELHRERPDLHVLMISRRDAEATRAKAESLGLTFPIVMQWQWEVSLQYGMFATPIGYLIDEQGIVAKDVAVGIAPILALADEPQTADAEIDRPLHTNEHEAALAT
jgi:peroxiredoxin